VGRHQQATQEAEPDKLSGELRRRLARMASDRPVRAVVLLNAEVSSGRGQSRREAIVAVRRTAASAKAALDPLVARVGGRWLADEPDALGSLGVEITAAGLRELAESEHVKAILEDQRVTVLPRPRR
jgi:hypothetical protein